MKIPDHIMKFWKDSGFKIKVLNVYITEDTSCIMWQAIKYDSNISVIDVQIVAGSPALYVYDLEEPKSDIVYHWNENKYSEEEMLRLIQQKAFI